MNNSMGLKICFSLLAIIVLCTCYIGCLLTTNEFVHADYDDIVADSNAIVNFNQISNEIGIQHDGTIGSSGFNNHGTTYFPSTLNGSHRYLVKFYYEMISGSVSLALFSQGYTDVIFSSDNNGYSIITGWSTIALFRAYGTSNTYYDFTAYISIIDLDVMFGSDNIPTLSQCQELFVSDYYYYNAGTPVSFSGLNSYSQGFNDAFKSVDTIVDVALTSSNVFAVSGEVTSSSSLDSVYLSQGYNTSLVDLSFGFNFNTLLSAGDVITITLDTFDNRYNPNDTSTGVNTNGTSSINIGYYDNGTFIVLGAINLSDMSLVSQTNLGVAGYRDTYSNGSTSFTLNVPLNAIYFRIMSSKSGTFTGLNIHVTSTNTYLAIQNAYDSGYSKGVDSLISYYSVGGVGYNAIYQAGYQAYPQDDHFTFQKLISSAIDVPIQAFTNLFDFDILGVNMKTFYLSVFTLCVIITIIRLVL